MNSFFFYKGEHRKKREKPFTSLKHFILKPIALQGLCCCCLVDFLVPFLFVSYHVERKTNRTVPLFPLVFSVAVNWAICANAYPLWEVREVHRSIKSECVRACVLACLRACLRVCMRAQQPCFGRLEDSIRCWSLLYILFEAVPPLLNVAHVRMAGPQASRDFPVSASMSPEEHRITYRH